MPCLLTVSKSHYGPRQAMQNKCLPKFLPNSTHCLFLFSTHPAGKSQDPPRLTRPSSPNLSIQPLSSPTLPSSETQAAGALGPTAPSPGSPALAHAQLPQPGLVSGSPAIQPLTFLPGLHLVTSTSPWRNI